MLTPRVNVHLYDLRCRSGKRGARSAAEPAGAAMGDSSLARFNLLYHALRKFPIRATATSAPLRIVTNFLINELTGQPFGLTILNSSPSLSAVTR